MSDARRLLAGLRTGRPPSPDDLAWFVSALTRGEVSDAQAGAFVMGICHTPLPEEGRVALTRAMATSGDTLDWDLPGPVLDKHSTGGVGDCVSLVLAPALAACGAFVPMISGRGLGHTGGTLDKLEAIPGVSTEQDAARFATITRKTGCAIVAASTRTAPADRRLYAVRDVTSTVESLDLITASILSKKLAAGLDALVLDVKLGSGAFMKTREEAEALARVLVETANAAGLATRALITDMSQPLAPALGNALEVAEVLAVLVDGREGRLLGLTKRLGGELLAQGGLAADAAAGEAAVLQSLSSGAAAARFAAMIRAMGGPADILESADALLPKAPVVQPVPAPRSGFVASIDGAALGRAVVDLGGGRRVETDRIDPAVGLSEVADLGMHVLCGDPLAWVHAADADAAAQAVAAVQSAIVLSGEAPALPPLVQGIVAAAGEGAES